MSDNLDQALGSLSEQTKKLDMALFFTHGDKDKAKDMIAGTYQDMYAIKAKFSASSMFGAYLMFFSIPFSTLIDSLVLVSKSYEVDDLKSNVNWKTFEKEIDEFIQKGEKDSDFTDKLKRTLEECFTIQIKADRINELKKFIDLEDEIAINRLMKKFVQDKLEFQNINISVDYEQISSLDMELHSISNTKINQSEMQQYKEEKEEKESKKLKVEEKPAEEDELEGKDVQLILKGNLILSPIKGKHISSLLKGDRIKINLDEKNPKAVSIAKAFKAYNEEEKKMQPLPARVVTTRHLQDGGYKIFALIAKGIYAKIMEEEDNIKVAVDFSASWGDEEESTASKNKVQLLIIIFVVFVILVTVVIFLVK